MIPLFLFKEVNMAKERTCFACGQKYVWCNTCHDFDPTETYKNLYHSLECVAISQIWYAYRGKEISKEEARRELQKYPEVLEKVFQYDSILAKEIQAIFDLPEENVETKQVETKQAETDSEVPVKETQKETNKPRTNRNKSNRK